MIKEYYIDACVEVEGMNGKIYHEGYSFVAVGGNGNKAAERHMNAMGGCHYSVHTGKGGYELYRLISLLEKYEDALRIQAEDNTTVYGDLLSKFRGVLEEYNY